MAAQCNNNEVRLRVQTDNKQVVFSHMFIMNSTTTVVDLEQEVYARCSHQVTEGFSMTHLLGPLPVNLVISLQGQGHCATAISSSSGSIVIPAWDW